MSTVIPLGARSQRALPIPRQQHYRAAFDSAFKKAGIDTQELVTLFEQRWTNLTDLISHLTDDKSLEPVWKTLGAREQRFKQHAVLQLAFQYRFDGVKGRIYETTSQAQFLAHEMDPNQITLGSLGFITGKPVYIQLTPYQTKPLLLDSNPDYHIVGGFFQYVPNELAPKLYYQLHIRSMSHATMGGHIPLDNPAMSLQETVDSIFQHDPNNQHTLTEMLKIWAAWSSGLFKETPFLEHDIIANQPSSNKKRRLFGAFNRITLEARGH